MPGTLGTRNFFAGKFDVEIGGWQDEKFLS